MTVAKNLHLEYPQFDKYSRHLTEKSVCYALEKKGIKFKRDFNLHSKIGDVPFNKRRKHAVDLVLRSQNGHELYVEIKGEMTYLEVNKLLYLHGMSLNFYILQLTEIDWIEPYDKSKHKSMKQKSKDDFEKQIDELVDFVRGTISGKELSKRSIKRLNDYINFRNKDLEVWKTLL